MGIAVTAGVSGIVVRVQVRIAIEVVVGIVARLVARLALLGPVELCVREIPPGSLEYVVKLVRLILRVVRLHGEEATGKDFSIIPVKALEELGVACFIR
jgi:hypothetical protein